MTNSEQRGLSQPSGHDKNLPGLQMGEIPNQNLFVEIQRAATTT